MSLRTSRTSLRAVVATAAVAGAVLVPAAGAFAADSASQKPNDASAQEAGGKQDTSPELRKYTLIDGSTVTVTGAKGAYVAKITFAGGKGTATLTTAKPTGTYNGMKVTLNADGTVTSVEEEDQGKDASWVRYYTLKDGSKAKVTKDGKGGYTAVITANGQTVGTLTTARPNGNHNGLHVTLHKDGTVTSWLEGGDAKKNDAAEKNTGHGASNGKSAQQGGAKQLPKGGVAAGEEMKADTAASPAMVAGSVAAAAALGGAGYVVVRRRQSNEG
ncbi:hypothetical protein [Streptomyces sp. RPT161]|uniref:hypothetical protein n=1 Tax=Streptomyces sp. RPT161 TaxID=3015993 RepID=UPI0022B9213B|nr:hypothetical protein [Streptomyces sp. RPT161]